MIVGATPVTTERLRGDRPRAEDLHPWSRIFLDERVDEEAWPAQLRTPEEALRLHDLDLAHWERFSFGPWSLFDRASGAYVGRAGLAHVRLGGRPERELAWFIDPDRHGEGLATEIARETVRVAFEVLEVDDVVAFTTVGNGASQAVMRKLGMEREADFEHAGLPHVLFRLTR